MTWVIAARYGFSAAEIGSMKLSDLKFWYQGVKELNRHEGA